jgi:hypothetical protein
MIEVDPLIHSELERMHPLPDGGRADWSDVLRRAGSHTGAGRLAVVRRRWPLIAMAAAAVLAVVLVATPAWALVRDVLPFFNQPSAPSSVMVNFSAAMDAPDIPPATSPQADAGNAREIMQANFGGETHTLYVAPVKNNQFAYCEWWSGEFGSCPRAWADQSGPMGVFPNIVFPHDASQPAQPIRVMLPPSEQLDLARHGVPDWLVVDVASPTVANVVIHFSDGTTVQPEITFVSDPINAGFVAYQVPNDQQSATNHVTEIDAYDSNGNLIERQPLAPMTAPTGSATTGR